MQRQKIHVFVIVKNESSFRVQVSHQVQTKGRIILINTLHQLVKAILPSTLSLVLWPLNKDSLFILFTISKQRFAD